ncbi:magnesium transporter MgtE N-terminal domain-containing protein [Granulicella cerasi]|uniref:Magnesium transporter MgtE N-terminal domain-containing protein n=1 Tax=Granulicella cerasi TaxID=741063 RepID=A0ABW1Z6I3_9BACT|nr:CBS domain-containing protein [Granulicella cerasi]
MSDLHTIPTSVSTLVGMRVLDADGKNCGRVHEFAVSIDHDGAHVAGLILDQHRSGTKHRVMLPIGEVIIPRLSDRTLRTDVCPTDHANMNDYLLLERDLLDQQIIDVDGRKVVRVNDVNLAWEKRGRGKGKAVGLRIEEVEVGLRGALRRLLKGLPPESVEKLAEKLPARVIPWTCVDLIERDPARRVRLKIGQERLSALHPSDIAAILEELAPAEREAVFTALPEETAAEALEEIDPKLQKELLSGMDSEHAAEIIEEMDPGAAADVLSELSDEETEAILEELEPEERQDIEELLEYEPDSAAGQMTTDFVSAAKHATVADAVQALREFEGDPDTITEIYLTGEDDKFDGVVTLPRLLLAKPETSLHLLTEIHRVSCDQKTNHWEVAALFDKYNLRSLPVLDHRGRVAGAIHAEQVIAQLRED